MNDSYRQPAPVAREPSHCRICGYPTTSLSRKKGPSQAVVNDHDHITYEPGPDIYVCGVCDGARLDSLHEQSQPSLWIVLKTVAYATNLILSELRKNAASIEAASKGQ